MHCFPLPFRQRSAHDEHVKKTPSKRAQYGLIAFFLISGLLFFAGAAYAWWDEHGGEAGTAHVTDCYSSGLTNRNKSVHCDATWIYNGRRATGYLENARMNYEGRTMDVRIHGTSHVTVTSYWVPIGLALFGVFEVAVCVMIVRSFRRRNVTGVPEPEPGSAA
jgi:hypothetical protein